MLTARLISCLILFESVVCCWCFFAVCPPCDHVQCPRLNCHSSLQVLEPECGCCATCAKRDGETCGGLTNEVCGPNSVCTYRIGLVIGENRTGICEPAECKRMQCTYRRFCRYGHHDIGTLLLCKCQFYHCAEKYHPVCGYDDKTYTSQCDLQSEECVKNKFIGLKHHGPCLDTPEPPTTVVPRVRTTAIPSHGDDLFDQIVHPEQKPELPTPVEQGCTFSGNVYAPNSMILVDPCTYMHCDVNQSLAMIIVPGCPGGPIDPDYGVTKPPVHGGWSEWEELGCVGTCFAAKKTRRRTCTNPTPLYEGRLCHGPSEEVFKCIPEHCNYTCEYDEWSDWSPCSVTCGTGTQTRTRGLVNNITEDETNNCDLVETRPCSTTVACPTYCRRIIVGYEKMLDDKNCETVRSWPVIKCDGPCDSGEGGCCSVSAKKRMNRPVQCPGEEYWRYSRFQYISECSCSGNCQQVEPLQSF